MGDLKTMLHVTTKQYQPWQGRLRQRQWTWWATVHPNKTTESMWRYGFCWPGLGANTSDQAGAWLAWKWSLISQRTVR